MRLIHAVEKDFCPMAPNVKLHFKCNNNNFTCFSRFWSAIPKLFTNCILSASLSHTLPNFPHLCRKFPLTLLTTWSKTFLISDTLKAPADKWAVTQSLTYLWLQAQNSGFENLGATQRFSEQLPEIPHLMRCYIILLSCQILLWTEFEESE